jgi:hypothetical protein
MESSMGIVMLMIGGGFIFSLLVFVYCEEKSLKSVDFSDMKCMMTKEVGLSTCLEQFNTVKYIGIYFISILIFNVLIANYIFIANGFALQEILLYIFVTSFLGSAIILLVKWTYQPMMKLLSSFMFGSIFIGAAAIAFGLTYLLAR